jgi:2-dehydropantoate 2-reductase
MNMNIAIIGLGGVGGYFGGKICKQTSMAGVNVFFVARGKHLDEIRKNGLRVSAATEGEWVCSPTLATDRIEELPVLDICLLCVKSYDLRNAVSRLCHKVSGSALLVPLLNGIDVYERIREDLHTARVLPACVYMSSQIETYGKVTQKGGACKILLGADPHVPGPVPDQLFGLFKASTIKYEWFVDVSPEIWGKYVFISPFGLVTAAFDKTIGQVMESSALSKYVLSVMGEIVQLSKEMGVALPETIIADSYQKGSGFPYETKTSFQLDFEAMNRLDERDLFGGAILRLGKRLGIDTPVTRELWDMLNLRKPVPDESFNT